jgi:hypothetical protein
MRRSMWASLIGLGIATAVSGCGGASQTEAQRAQAAGKSDVGANDASRCDFKGRADREVVESAGPGALQPNVRRVFGILGEGEDRRRVLFCREIDTNLDGVKDVVRTYNDKGDAVDEQADSNYDGRVDTWIRFAGGRISKVELDRNNDSRPDETRYYVKGKISRVQRDSNHDAKMDVWEVYADGQLERMGVDLDFDGHVDRWDRDEIAHRIAEERERAEEEKAEAAKKAEEEATPPQKADEPKPGADGKKPEGEKTPETATKPEGGKTPAEADKAAVPVDKKPADAAKKTP